MRCSSRGCKESDATEQLNWTDLPQVGTRGSEGISPLWPPLPGKIIKRFFSTSPKTAFEIQFDTGVQTAELSSNETDHLGSITDKTVWDCRVSLYHLSFSPTSHGIGILVL